MIIDPENQNNNTGNGSPNPDEFVDSSFMVSFKANESASVSDKIKESENPQSNPMFDEFDEFENFDFDASKSAFKPLDKPVTVEKTAPVEPAKAADKTDFEQVAPVNDPAFTDGNVDFKEFTGFQEDTSIDKKLFESGQDLDFASSSDSKSSFSGGLDDDEFGLDEEAGPVLEACLTARRLDEFFGNGRDVANLVRDLQGNWSEEYYELICNDADSEVNLPRRQTEPLSDLLE